VIDVRVLNPLKAELILESVRKTRRLLAVDGDWASCGFASEVVARVAEELPTNTLLAPPRRITLPDAPAPTSASLERNYYTTTADVIAAARQLAGVRGDSWE
jgi:pyruvate dehydrogenase E1 component beta subunit